jgi:hypothetical protein
MLDHQRVKGFEQHGARFTEVANNQAIGVCPFCFKPKHFMADVNSTVW